jgi:hypothetical protein
MTDGEPGPWRTMTQSPPPHLRAAYEATAYEVHDSPVGPFTIRCGVVSPQVDALLADAGLETWAFITAWNPGSVRLDDAENRHRHAELRSWLTARGLRWFPAAGVPAAGDWPPEESLLVLGLDEPATVPLGRAFGQRAVVVGSRGLPARLLWL